MAEREPMIWQSPGFRRRGTVIHGMSTRIGGVSAPPYDRWNMGFHTGDDPKNVIANREIFAQAMHVPLTRAVVGEQIHGAQVKWIGETDAGRGATTAQSGLKSVDGLATDVRQLPLIGLFADCVPVFFTTDDEKAVGLAHAGWKGTWAGISGEMVRLFAGRGWAPDRLHITFGPCIQPCCFEVDETLALRFERRFGPEVVKRSRAGKPAVDLILANQLTLADHGMPRRNMEAKKVCTMCEKDLYFSHRRDGVRTGRMAALIALR